MALRGDSVLLGQQPERGICELVLEPGSGAAVPALPAPSGPGSPCGAHWMAEGGASSHIERNSLALIGLGTFKVLGEPLNSAF